MFAMCYQQHDVPSCHHSTEAQYCWDWWAVMDVLCKAKHAAAVFGWACWAVVERTAVSCQLSLHGPY